MAFAITWNPDAIYVGVKVIDDNHENSGSGWDGDSLQLVFTNSERNAAEGDTLLYNYALDNDHAHVLDETQHSCGEHQHCTKAAMEVCIRRHATGKRLQFRSTTQHATSAP